VNKSVNVEKQQMRHDQLSVTTSKATSKVQRWGLLSGNSAVERQQGDTREPEPASQGGGKRITGCVLITNATLSTQLNVKQQNKRENLIM